MENNFELHENINAQHRLTIYCKTEKRYFSVDL